MSYESAFWVCDVSFRELRQDRLLLASFNDSVEKVKNVDKKVAIPADPFITQVIKADGNGVFSYTMPRAGWWSFAALVDGDEKLQNQEGKMVNVELGGLIWVRTKDMKNK